MTDKKSKVIDELISSEESYLKQLVKIEVYFSIPIKEKGFIISHEGLSIFSQLSTIYQMNKRLLEEILNEKQDVGQAFLKIGPFLKAYSSYANSFQQYISLLEDLQNKNEQFKEFVRSTETRPEVHSKLTALLITPIQRIPRYRLLLEELLKYSDFSSTDYQNILAAKNMVSSVAEHINQSVDEAQNLQRVMTLQKAFRNQQPNIIAPGRKLIKEGIINKVSRKGNGSQPRMFFLFSDMVTYSKITSQSMSSTSNAELCLSPDLKPNSLECCCVLPLRYCRVTVIFGDDEHGITFRLQCCDEDLVLYCESSSEGHAWITAIKNAAYQALQKRKTLRKASSKKRAIRRTALQKLRYTQDEDDTPSPKKRTPDPISTTKSFTGSFTPEMLMNHLRQAKECLTPSRIWATPQKFLKKEPEASKETSVPGRINFNGSNNANKLNTSFNSNSRDLFYKSQNFNTPLSPRHFINYEKISRSSPHGISPLALCSSNGFFTENDDKSDSSEGYNLRSSVTLRKKARFSAISPSTTCNTFEDVENEKKKKKRPVSDFISMRIFNYKKSKKH